MLLIPFLAGFGLAASITIGEWLYRVILAKAGIAPRVVSTMSSPRKRGGR